MYGVQRMEYTAFCIVPWLSPPVQRLSVVDRSLREGKHGELDELVLSTPLLWLYQIFQAILQMGFKLHDRG